MECGEGEVRDMRPLRCFWKDNENIMVSSYYSDPPYRVNISNQEEGEVKLEVEGVALDYNYNNNVYLIMTGYDEMVEGIRYHTFSETDNNKKEISVFNQKYDEENKYVESNLLVYDFTNSELKDVIVVSVDSNSNFVNWNEDGSCFYGNDY